MNDLLTAFAVIAFCSSQALAWAALLYALRHMRHDLNEARARNRHLLERAQQAEVRHRVRVRGDQPTQVLPSMHDL